MPLPNELLNAMDETTVIGDLDAFMAYVESGQAWLDWRQLRAMAVKELDGFIQSRSRSWHHIVSQGPEPSLALPAPQRRAARNLS
jgi:hypothetical protein